MIQSRCSRYEHWVDHHFIVETNVFRALLKHRNTIDFVHYKDCNSG